MTARTILTVFFVAFVLAEAKWHNQKQEVSSICDNTYDIKYPLKLMCYCVKEVKDPEIVKSAECYLNVEDVKRNDHVWDTLDSLKSATKLSLTNTRGIPFRYVPTHGLKYLDGILDIDINHGNIERIHSFAFANISTVEDISLRDNQIKILERYAFAHHRDLSVIKLDKNNIEEIYRDVFVNLPFLEKLFLTDNEITTIHDGAFAQLSTLRELEINMNKLYSLNSDSFRGLIMLLRLDLSSNNLQVIGDNTFRPLSSLQSLNLEENRIQILDSKAFSGLMKLQHLSLAHNHLSDIDDDMVFTRLESLKTLNLRGNEMKHLKASVMKPLLENFYVAGSHLDVDDNLFPCSCNLDWFLVLMNRTSSKSLKVTLENLKCVPDAKLKDKWAIFEETEKSSAQTVNAEETHSETEYEYYDESQLNGNLFYTDIRDLIDCNKANTPLHNPTSAIIATTSHITNVAPHTSKTTSAETKSLKRNPSDTFAEQFTNPPKPATAPLDDTTSTTSKMSTTPSIELHKTNFDSNKGQKRENIHNNGLLDLDHYETIEHSKEQDENTNSIQKQPDYTTAHLVSVSAKPVEKNSVYENMAADEAKPDSSNKQAEGEAYSNSGRQNVGCVVILLICIRLFH